MIKINLLVCVVILSIGFSGSVMCDQQNHPQLSSSFSQLLQQVSSDQNKLSELIVASQMKLTSAQESNSNEAFLSLLVNHQNLVKKFITIRATDLNLSLAKAKKTYVDGLTDEVKVDLLALKKEYSVLIKDFDIIELTIQAEINAEYTQKESKMFYKMKMKADKPPTKALKAYGLMGLARRTRDQGRFRQALEQWAKAETMIKEAKTEYISDRAERRKQWRKDEELKAIGRVSKVKSLLENDLVLIPSGDFRMGSNVGGSDEMPIREVSISSFMMGKTEVTFELWELCVQSGSCFFVPKDQGWGTEDMPVIGVSHRDIHMRFLPWLKKITGKDYRLPTESEWEYAARAGSDASYSWGEGIHCSLARYDGGVASACNTRELESQGPLKVKNYKPNAFGLYDMHGNVWEWVQDCWVNNYQQAPVNGSANLSGNCNVRVLRGGSWDYHKNGLRSANRYYAHFKTRKPSIGFRLALDVADAQ